MLAGMSVDYYTRLERGNLSGASDSVLESLARALQLDDAETSHLFDLARAAGVAPRMRRRRSPKTVRPSLQRVIDAIVTAPAWVRNDRGDVLAVNELGRALYLDLMAETVQPPNNCTLHLPQPERPRRSIRTGNRRRTTSSPSCARPQAGIPTTRTSPTSSASSAPAARSSAIRWARHDVRYHRTGTQAHPPPDRRRPRSGLRSARARRRTRAAGQRLHGRSRHALPRTPSNCSPAGPPPSDKLMPSCSTQSEHAQRDGAA